MEKITLYKLSRKEKIEPTVVDRVTEHSFFVGGRKNALRTEFDNYFKTKQEAIDFKNYKVNAQIKRHKENIDKLSDELVKFNEANGDN